jgi:hypothetical protein
VRILALLILASACGAHENSAPLANRGGTEVPAEPPVVTVDAAQLARTTVDLDRATPMTLVVVGSPAGMVYLDGKALGLAPVRTQVAPGHHHLMMEIEGY